MIYSFVSSNYPLLIHGISVRCYCIDVDLFHLKLKQISFYLGYRTAHTMGSVKQRLSSHPKNFFH